MLSGSDKEGSTPRQDEEKLLRRKYQLEKELQQKFGVDAGEVGL